MERERSRETVEETTTGGRETKEETVTQVKHGRTHCNVPHTRCDNAALRVYRD